MFRRFLGVTIILVMLAYVLWPQPQVIIEDGICIGSPSTVYEFMSTAELSVDCNFCRPVVAATAEGCSAFFPYNCRDVAVTIQGAPYNCDYTADGDACVPQSTACRLVNEKYCRQATPAKSPNPRSCSNFTSESLCNLNAQINMKNITKNCKWNGTSCTPDPAPCESTTFPQGASCKDCIREVGENNYKCSNVDYCDATACNNFFTPIQKMCASIIHSAPCYDAKYSKVSYPCEWVYVKGQCQKFGQHCQIDDDCCNHQKGCKCYNVPTSGHICCQASLGLCTSGVWDV